MIAVEWCVCYSPCGLDAAAEVPVTDRPHDWVPCLQPGPHLHLCTRTAGHSGRHAEYLDESLVSAVWAS